MQISKAHTEFIRLVANGENQSDAYSLTSPNKSLTKGTIKVESSKLAKKYAKQIAEQRQKNKDIVDSANKIELQETSKMHLMSVARRMEILSDIAEGKIPLKKPMVCDGVIELIEIVPDWMDRRNAIAELNKMTGDYATIKTDITSKGESIKESHLDLSKLSNEALRELAGLTDPTSENPISEK